MKSSTDLRSKYFSKIYIIKINVVVMVESRTHKTPLSTAAFDWVVLCNIDVLRNICRKKSMSVFDIEM